MDEFAALQEELVARDRWILDGNYGRTLDVRLRRADLVVLLDAHPLLCAWRITRRQLRGWVTGRPHLRPDLPDRFDASLLVFLRYVLRYRRTRVPDVFRRAREHGVPVAHLRSRGEVRRFIAALAAERDETEVQLPASRRLRT